MRLRRAVTPALAALLTGSMLSGTVTRVAAQDRPLCDQRAPTFRAPIRLGNGLGYEPSIESDSKGTIYVMAHKRSLTNEGSRTASWLWRSTDDGVTFENMAGPAGATDFAFAFEGDGAVDANDVFYYVDTWAAENHLSVYDDRGAVLEHWRPFVVSAEADDRPWLAAHGNGYVYYPSNTVIGAFGRGRLTVHRSTDGGLTFDPVGFNFPRSGWGFIDADPNSSYVYAFMDDDGASLDTWVSPDRGVTWSKHHVTNYENGASPLGFPAVAVSPVDGSIYAAWGDGLNKVKIARSTDRGQTWQVFDVTPFTGSFGHVWVAVGPDGDVGLTFDADPTKVSGNARYVYGMIWRPTSDCVKDPARPDEVCTGPSLIYGRAWGTAVPSQEHFIQIEITPDDAMALPFEASGGPIRFTKQTSGPNMSDAPSCGIVGTP